MFKKAACILIAVMLLVIVFSGCDILQGEKETEDKATKEVGTNIESYPGELTNILFMGSMNGNFSDENNQNYALTHMLLTIDPTKKSMRITTFPYNLKIKPFLEEEDLDETQLQFMYAQYGADIVVDTISERFNVDIDGWVVMNMDGVKKIVDDIGGLEVEVLDLTVNDMAQTVEVILGYVWQEIKSEGEQVLNGIQITGFFMDTYNNLDKENPTVDEELRFRKKNKTIINALVTTMKALEMESNQVVDIAHKVEDNFLTDIKERDWDKIAKMAIACSDDIEYLHVPDVIEVEENDSMRSIVYDVKDVNNVSVFVRGE